MDDFLDGLDAIGLPQPKTYEGMIAGKGTVYIAREVGFVSDVRRVHVGQAMGFFDELGRRYRLTTAQDIREHDSRSVQDKH
eukprot:2786202-Rhodomonas_salina.1